MKDFATLNEKLSKSEGVMEWLDENLTPEEKGEFLSLSYKLGSKIYAQ